MSKTDHDIINLTRDTTVVNLQNVSYKSEENWSNSATEAFVENSDSP